MKLFLGPIALFVLIHLVFLVDSASLVDHDICQNYDLCKNGGTCYTAQSPGLNDAPYHCVCPDCFEGTNCEINKCQKAPTSLIVLRVICLIVTAALGCLAFLMFTYRLNVVSHEEEIPATPIVGTSLTASHVTKYKGKDSLVVKTKASASGSLCSSLYGAFTPKVKPPPKVSKTLEKRLVLWRQQNLTADLTPKEPVKRRAPAWDEIEMRRHGLVNRHCHRIYAPDCPSNPSSVDVSICNSQQGMPSSCSQASIQYKQPSDPPSVGIPSPIATSTPQSQSNGSILASGSSHAMFSKPYVVETAQSVTEPINKPSAPGPLQSSVYMDPGLGNRIVPESVTQAQSAHSGAPPQFAEAAQNVSETIPNPTAAAAVPPVTPASVYMEPGLHDSKYYAF